MTVQARIEDNQEEERLKILECSTQGDKRFSALCAKVTINGETKSIENWYQLSKRFSGKKPIHFKQAKQWQYTKGKPTSFVFLGNEYEIKYLSSLYEVLWVKYFDANPDLLKYAKQFDGFSDRFRTPKTINCQADVIRDIVKYGREHVINRNREFLEMVRNQA